ncbi:hypothetical protein [Streptomyces rochei]|uniref:hypothetical protein n=1 Tax=Streptomyces rochei TaxID=1928 RepID=UPI0033AEB93A
MLQILLALVACLLGIVTNYATSKDDAPWALEMIQRWSVPAIGLLVVAMMAGQFVVYRLENPAPHHRSGPVTGFRIRGWTRSARTRRPSTSVGRRRLPS